MSKNSAKDSNRAFETAKLTSYWLYLAKIPEAIEFGKKIGLDKMDASAISFSKEMCHLNPIIHEIRYKAINRQIKASGCKNVLDIACGYSPRGFQLANEGYNYYGVDFPVVVKDLNEIVEKSGIKNCKYQETDATNHESLKQIVSKIEGPICVVVEGLGMYLTAEEAATVRRNIARILYDRPGSVYITTDPANGHITAKVIQSIYPMSLFMPTIGMIFKMYNTASDGGITMETAARPLKYDLEQYKKSCFKVKRCALFDDASQLFTFNDLPEESIKKLNKLIKEKLVFVSTLVENKNFSLDSDSQNLDADNSAQDFKMKTSVHDNVLEMNISGHIDILSAPKILESFRSSRTQVQDVKINMKHVTYLSSAGKRVLRLIMKELGDDGNLTIEQINPALGENALDDEIIKKM